MIRASILLFGLGVAGYSGAAAAHAARETVLLPYGSPWHLSVRPANVNPVPFFKKQHARGVFGKTLKYFSEVAQELTQQHPWALQIICKGSSNTI